MCNRRVLLAVTLLACIVALLGRRNEVAAETNKDRLFVNIKEPIGCVRRFNATNQIGCGDLDRKSYDGVVYAVRNVHELQRLAKIDSMGPYNLVIVVMPAFFDQLVDFYKTSRIRDAINGIVLIASDKHLRSQSESPPIDESDDAQSPDSLYSLYAFSLATNSSTTVNKVAWNAAAGRGFMFQQFRIPFYAITDEAEADVPFDSCYDKFNKNLFEQFDSSADSAAFKLAASDSVCGMQLGLEMFGAVNSHICLRRATIAHTVESNTFCDPLGVTSYFTFVSQQPSNQLPIVLLSARIDAFTMFEYFTPGANQPISAIVAMLALVELLVKHRAQMSRANVLVVLFDNEALDYGGSSRFANDLLLDAFPSFDVNAGNGSTIPFRLSKANMTTMIELNQLGSVGLDVNTNLFVHKDPLSYNKDQNVAKIIDDLVSKLEKFSNGSVKAVSDANQALPPSSLHSFLRQNINLAGISIADHETTFKNTHYHSVFDTPQTLNVTFANDMSEADAVRHTTLLAARLQSALTSVAQTIFAISVDPADAAASHIDDSATVDIATLNALVYCFYKNNTCSFFQSMMSDKEWAFYLKLLASTLPKQQLSFFTSVNDNAVSGKWLTAVLLRYFTRNVQADAFNATECKVDSASMRQLSDTLRVTLKSVLYVNNSRCAASAIYAVSSRSPAFAHSDDGYLVNTDRFSAWTESSWAGTEIQMRIFMYGNRAIEALSLALGILIAIASLFATYFANKYAEKMFATVGEQQQTESTL